MCLGGQLLAAQGASSLQTGKMRFQIPWKTRFLRQVEQSKLVLWNSFVSTQPECNLQSKSISHNYSKTYWSWTSHNASFLVCLFCVVPKDVCSFVHSQDVRTVQYGIPNIRMPHSLPAPQRRLAYSPRLCINNLGLVPRKEISSTLICSLIRYCIQIGYAGPTQEWRRLQDKKHDVVSSFATEYASE